MKKADIAMIILIAYFVANSLFGGAANESVKVQTIDPIDATIVEPSSTIFNTNAINPAVEVQINGTQ